MIHDYNWPHGAAGAADERVNRSERKRDPIPQAGDEAKTPAPPQQGDGTTASEQQQQQDTIIRDWASF